MSILKNLALVGIFSLSAMSSRAQEPALGDVARATRAHAATSPHPANVYSNEDAAPVSIKPGDDPLEVYQRASKGLLQDTSHRCESDSAGNSGPGWKIHTVLEIAGPARMHIVTDDDVKKEWITLEEDSYIRLESTPWQKLTQQQKSATGGVPFPFPEELMYRLEPGDLKFVASEPLNGIPSLHYRDSIHTYDLDRTIDYWFGVHDGLPHHIEMTTNNRDMGTSWRESIVCTYRPIEIKAPM